MAFVSRTMPIQAMMVVTSLIVCASLANANTCDYSIMQLEKHDARDVESLEGPAAKTQAANVPAETPVVGEEALSRKQKYVMAKKAAAIEARKWAKVQAQKEAEAKAKEAEEKAKKEAEAKAAWEALPRKQKYVMAKKAAAIEAKKQAKVQAQKEAEAKAKEAEEKAKKEAEAKEAEAKKKADAKAAWEALPKKERIVQAKKAAAKDMRKWNQLKAQKKADAEAKVAQQYKSMNDEAIRYVEANVPAEGPGKACPEGLRAPNWAPDAGFVDNFRGWYDAQGCGECLDYCRWVGTSGSGGDPALQTKHGESYWSCFLAGHGDPYTKGNDGTLKDHFGATFLHKKCVGVPETVPAGAHKVFRP